MPFAAAKGSSEYLVMLDVVLSKYQVCSLPSNIVVNVVFVALLSQELRERVFATLDWIANRSPLFQRTVHTNAIIVDLVAATEPKKSAMSTFNTRTQTYMT